MGQTASITSPGANTLFASLPNDAASAYLRGGLLPSDIPTSRLLQVALAAHGIDFHPITRRRKHSRSLPLSSGVNSTALTNDILSLSPDMPVCSSF